MGYGRDASQGGFGSIELGLRAWMADQYRQNEGDGAETVLYQMVAELEWSQSGDYHQVK